MNSLKQQVIQRLKFNLSIISNQKILFFTQQKRIKLKEYSIIKDNKSQVYNLDEFIFLTDKKILKGKNVVTATNYNMPKSDKFYFSEGIFDLDNQNCR